MSKHSYPKNPNIFLPPEITDAIEEIPTGVAEGVYVGVLKQAIESRRFGIDAYTRSIVFSSGLKAFYDSLLQAYDFSTRLARERGRHDPVAIIQENEHGRSYDLFAATATSSIGSLPITLHLTEALPGNDRERRFGLALRAGSFTLQGWAGSPIVIRHEVEPRRVYAPVIDTTKWLQNGDTIHIQRVPEFAAIAIGATAIEALPYFGDLSKAYDQFYDTTVQAPVSHG